MTFLDDLHDECDDRIGKLASENLDLKAEIERLRAEYDQTFAEGERATRLLEQAEARLAKVVEEMGERILALRAAHHDGDAVTWENAVKLAVDALAAAQPKEKP